MPFIKKHTRTLAERKKDISGFLSHSHKEYVSYMKTKNEIKLTQAGEKAWNAVIQTLCYLSGKSIDRHREISRVVKKLKGEYPEIEEAVDIGESLHANFYHNFMYEDTLKRNIDKVDLLIQTVLHRKEMI